MNKTNSNSTTVLTGVFTLSTVVLAGLAGVALLETKSPTVCASGHAIYAGLTLWSTFLFGTCLNAALDGFARPGSPSIMIQPAGVPAK